VGQLLMNESSVQVMCFAVQVTPLEGGTFIARDVSVIKDLLEGTGRDDHSMATHLEILSLAGSSKWLGKEAFPTLAELLECFATLLEGTGQLKVDMPLARWRRGRAGDVGHVRSSGAYSAACRSSGVLSLQAAVMALRHWHGCQRRLLRSLSQSHVSTSGEPVF
jgi:hypothetical protein